MFKIVNKWSHHNYQDNDKLSLIEQTLFEYIYGATGKEVFAYMVVSLFQAYARLNVAKYV